MRPKLLLGSLALAGAANVGYHALTYNGYAEPPSRTVYERIAEPIEVGSSEFIESLVKYQVLPTSPVRGALGTATMAGIAGIVAGIILPKKQRRP